MTRTKLLITAFAIILIYASTIVLLRSQSLQEKHDDKRPAAEKGKSNSQTKIIQSVLAATVNVEKYWDPPYDLPPAKGPSDEDFSETQMQNANTLGAAVAQIQPYLQKRFPATHVDPFLSVMWTMAIEGSGADIYFWNCNEGKDGGSKGKENISNGCVGWYNPGNWQVGYGVQVAQVAPHLAEDFKEIYGTTDASKVQEIGNRVIQAGGITNPATMPAKSVEQLVTEAGSPGTIFVKRPTTTAEAAAQQAIAILLMDPALSAVSIATEVANDINVTGSWNGTMLGWHQDHYTNGLNPDNPIFSNRIVKLAEKYTGVSSGLPTSNTGTVVNVAPLSLLVRPKNGVKDTYIMNKATAVASGVGTGASTGQPGSPLPSQDTEVVKKTLCDQYRVCPTQSPAPYTPDQDWTIDQLTALWNLVQRIYQSPTYKTLAIGNYTLEIARANCYPGGCDGTWGYYAGQIHPAYGNIDNARLITLTDLVPKTITAETPLGVIEWVIAHEIGHSASGGLPDGSLAAELGINQAYRDVEACGERVSDYGHKTWNENNSEILAFYMTAAEEAVQYDGPTKNLKADYKCTYEAVKKGYFGGVEF